MAYTMSVDSNRGNTQLTRSLERILEEAQLTGELNLSGRKFKEFPKLASKFELDDTVYADLSKNRLSELPHEICDYLSLERIDCYNNVIRNVPEDITYVQCLTHLNLSRNQLTTLPSALCHLQKLQVLIASHNKLVSLPEEIGLLSHELMELDVSCNELSHLPSQIGFLTALRALNLRRNSLVELPIEVTSLRLIKLDVSENRIVYLPTRLRFMNSLVELVLENNPLSCPPAALCARGRIHIFKFLENQAQKEDRKKDALGFESESRRPQRRPTPRLNGLGTDHRRKRYTVDSGYCPSEGDKRWSQDSQDLIDAEEPKKIGIKGSEICKDKRLDRGLQKAGLLNASVPNNSIASKTPPAYPYVQPHNLTNGDASNKNSVIDSNNEVNRSKDVGRHWNKNKVDSSPSPLEENDEIQLADEHRRTAAKVLEQQQEESRRNSSQRYLVSPTSSASAISAYSDHFSNSVSPGTANAVEVAALGGNSPSANVERNLNSLAHIQTYREYKEALRLQRSIDNNVAYRRTQADSVVGQISQDRTDGHSQSRIIQAVPAAPPLPPPLQLINGSAEDDDNLVNQDDVNYQRYEAQMAQIRLEEDKKKKKQIQKEAIFSYYMARTSPLRSSADSDRDLCSEDHNSKPTSPNLSPCPPSPLPNPPMPLNCITKTASPSTFSGTNGTLIHQLQPRPNGLSNLSFTMKRESERLREEQEQIERLRQAIEARLKVTLPDDLGPALSDGVVLCHLANHVRPRSVASIHVPSPAVPKLTVAKCRRNVENFLDACQRIGIPEEHLCTCDEILNGLIKPQKTLSMVLHLVNSSSYSKMWPKDAIWSPVTRDSKSTHDVFKSWLCLALFFSSLIILFLKPESI
ncbi:hypothetical protein CHUAL_003480 [Chamberlinius hualienensis]